MSQKILVPQLNPNDTEVELTHWYKKHGDAVKKGELLCDLTTSKAVTQLEAPGSGFVAILAPAKKRLRAGSVMALLCESAAEAHAGKATPADSGTGAGDVKTPVFSRAAQEALGRCGLEEADFAGQDFVTEKMVHEKMLGERPGRGSIVKEQETAVLGVAYHAALRSSLSVQLEAAELQARLDQERLSREGFLAWCVAQALKEHPRFLLAHGQESTPSAVDIAYALDLGTGIRLAAARDCAAWTPGRWAEQLADWSLRLMRNVLRAEELHDGRGGFTVTDLSSQGVLFFEPLLVGSQSAILGIGGDLEARNPLLTFTLAFDHRVHDGRSGAAFLKTLKALALKSGG